jgi:hypothetical protein
MSHEIRLFGSRTILGHLVRGIVGIGALVAASLVSGSYPAVWVVAIPIALIAFRGCPMCWTVGLAETVIGTVGVRSKNDVHCPRCGTETSRESRDPSDGG